MKGNSEYIFNLEIYRDSGNKEFKITNMPLSKLKEVIKDLEDKYF